MTSDVLANLVQQWLSSELTEEEYEEVTFLIENEMPGFLTRGITGLLRATRQQIIERVVSYRKDQRVFIAGEHLEVKHPYEEDQSGLADGEKEND